MCFQQTPIANEISKWIEGKLSLFDDELYFQNFVDISEQIILLEWFKEEKKIPPKKSTI